MVQISQNTFTGGEVTPWIYARSNLEQYRNSAAKVENFIIKTYGGLERRSGTRFVSQVKDCNKQTRLIPFKFGTTQAYVLEFGHLYMRVYKDYGQVLNGSNAVYEIATPFSESDLWNLKFSQSYDKMWLSDGVHPPQVLSRTGHASWTIQEQLFLDGPYLPENVSDSKKLTASGTTGTVTVNASGFSPFTSADVGRLVALHGGAKWGYGRITAYNSPSSVQVATARDFENVNATSKFKFGAFWGTNQPRAVAIYGARLWFGGTSEKPQTLYASRTNVYDDFSTSDKLVDTDAISWTLDSGEVNAIYWFDVNNKNDLMIGTSDSVWRLFSNDATKAIATATIKTERVQVLGCANIQGRQIGSAIMFVGSGKEVVHELAYQFDSDSYGCPEMTLLAQHITRGGVSEFAYQTRPNRILWAPRADGTLLGFTYMRDQKVTGWHRHILGGGGKVESVCVIPSPDGTQDDLWMVVRRTINGTTKRYVEVLTRSTVDATDNGDWFYVDSGLTYNGAPATTITGLSHLEGQTVQVFADGANESEATVVGGAITLDEAASKVHVGLGYTSTLQTLRAEVNPASTAQGKQKVIHSISLDCYKSVGGMAGQSLDDMREIFSIPYHEGPQATTEHKALDLGGGWNIDGQIYVQQDKPLPLNILAVIMHMSLER
jgi:hypothetical protein